MKRDNTTLKVLVITDVADNGGASKRLSLLARSAKPNYALTFVIVGPAGPLTEELQQIGAGVAALGVRRGVHYVAATARLLALAWRLRPDVVHGQLRYAGFLAVIVGALLRRPVMLTRAYTWYPGRHAFLDRLAFRAADRVVAVSRAAAAAAIADGAAPEKTAVIWNGITVSHPEPAESIESGTSLRAFRVGTLSNLLPVKGLETLVKAIGELARRGRVVEAVIAGEGPLRTSLQVLAAKEGVADRVRLPGFISNGVLLRDIDLYVQSSNAEGMSNSLLEALSHGLPAIATDVGGASEVIRDGETGLLIPPGDPTRLADAIARAQDSPLSNELLAANARRIRLEFGAEQMAEQYFAAYLELARP